MMLMLPAVRDEEYRSWGGEPHECFWCGHLTFAPFWSCRTCYPKKEASYKRLAEEGVTSWGEVIVRTTEACRE